jgi:hypothetical protein
MPVSVRLYQLRRVKQFVRECPHQLEFPQAHRTQGRSDSLSRLGYFERSQAEGAAGCRQPRPATAVTGAAAQAPAAALAQCGPTLDLRQSMVRGLAQFASYCEARNGPEMASTGLTCVSVLAIKSAAPDDW